MMDVNEALRVAKEVLDDFNERPVKAAICNRDYGAIIALAAEVQRLQRDAKADKQVIDTLGADVTRLEQENANLRKREDSIYAYLQTTRAVHDHPVKAVAAAILQAVTTAQQEASDGLPEAEASEGKQCQCRMDGTHGVDATSCPIHSLAASLIEIHPKFVPGLGTNDRSKSNESR